MLDGSTSFARMVDNDKDTLTGGDGHDEFVLRYAVLVSGEFDLEGEVVQLDGSLIIVTEIM